MDWVSFLKTQAVDVKLYPESANLFMAIFSEENKDKKDAEIKKIIADQLKIDPASYVKRKTEIYKKFENTKNCPNLENAGPHKAKCLREWLEDEYKKYLEAQSSTSATPEASESSSPTGSLEIATPTTSAIDTATDKQINWHNTCQAMVKQQQLTSNYLLGDYEDAKFEREQIYVPLALVVRTKPDKRSGEVSPEAGTRVYAPQYEQEQRFEHEDFLTQIKEQGQGKSKGKRIALIGEPGAGKTTLLQHIACCVMEKTSSPPRQQENKNVAIWISLADLKGRSLQKYLCKKWLLDALRVAHVTPDKEEALVELFNSGRVWLLLDGVDEMTSGEEPRQAIADQLTGWVASARVVLTCRMNVWQANVNFLADFETYRLLDFDYPQQVHQFIDKWFKTSDAAKGERLKVELGKAEQMRLQNLLQNPLRLALLCSTWRSREGKLPHTKAGLYQKFVQQFYDWQSHRFPSGSQEQKGLEDALKRLAKRDIDEGGSRFWLPESLISQELGKRDDDKSLFHLALRLGWLNNVGIAVDPNTEQKVYAFFHPTFEEYFAALAINDWRFFLNHIPDNPNHPDASYRIFEPQWKEVYLLWLGREDVPSEQKNELIKAFAMFKDGCDGFYEYRVCFLAAAGIAEFGDYYRADKLLNEIVRWSFGDFDDEKQQWRVSFYSFASRARAVLRETQRTIAIKRLESFIKDCQNEFTCIEAAEMLGYINNNNLIAIETLESFIQNSQDEYIRIAAAKSLASINNSNPIAITTLESFIQNSQDEVIRMKTASFLEYIDKKNPIAIEALESLIHNHQNINTCYEAAEALGRIGCLLNPEVINALESLIKDSDQPLLVRVRVASILGYFDKSNLTAITTLESFIQESYDEITRMFAAHGLARIEKGNLKAITTLESVIRTAHFSFIPTQAASFLGFIDNSNLLAINTLESSIQNSQNESTLCNAAEALGYIHKGNPIAIEALLSLIRKSHDKDICRRAVECLKNIEKAQMERVVTALKDYYLSNELREDDYERFENCFEVIWHCAQNLPYPTFYQAWHHPPLTPHPYVPETTSVGFTPNSQSLNLADLPNCLRAILDSDSDLRNEVQLICIDGNKFINRNNPAIRIYHEMRSHGCPKYSDGKPKTMVQLQDYWDELRLKSVRTLVLVFYENPIAPPQGFSETFLNALCRFDGAICALSDQPNIPLQSFSPNQPNLDINLVEWIKKIVLENP